MRPWLFAITSCLLFGAFAQDSQPDSVTVKEKSRFLTPRLYWDYGKTVVLWNPESSKTEIGLELLLWDRIQLIGEGGISQFTPSQAYKNVDYTSEGTYWRLGIGYLGYLDQQNRIGIGGRYAQASFEDRGIVKIKSESGFNDELDDLYERTNLEARWFEIVLDSERQLLLNKDNPDSYLNRLLSIGIMFRYRVKIEAPNFEPVDVFAIPGFGRNNNSRVVALNLFLKVSF